jgi:hypothetical protein
MNKTALKRILSVVLCFCLVAIFTFSLSYITTHEHHDCSGEHCPVCVAIQAAQNVLKTLTALAAVSVLTAILALQHIGWLDRVQSFEIPLQTLQTLKVQLNN